MPPLPPSPSTCAWVNLKKNSLRFCSLALYLQAPATPRLCVRDRRNLWPFFFFNSLLTCLRERRVGKSYVRWGGDVFSDEAEKKVPLMKIGNRKFPEEHKKISDDRPDI